MSDCTGTPNLHPQGCGGASNLNDNSISVCSNEITTVCITDSDTYYIETPAAVGVPWVDVAPDDAGKFLSNDGERAYWQTVAYSEENFTTTLKEELESLISGDYSWKENQW